MKTISYSNTLELKVTAVDNEFTVSLNQDIPGGAKIAEVYKRSVSGFSTYVNDTIDLAKTITGLSGSAIFTAVLSNYAEGGGAAFELIADGVSVFKENKILKEYSSTQWALSIKQN